MASHIGLDAILCSAAEAWISGGGCDVQRWVRFDRLPIGFLSGRTFHSLPLLGKAVPARSLHSKALIISYL